MVPCILCICYVPLAPIAFSGGDSFFWSSATISSAIGRTSADSFSSGQLFQRASVTRFEVIHRDHEGEQFVIEVRFVDQCAKEAQTFLIDQSPESRDDFGSPHRFSDFFVPDSTGRVESAA